MAKYLLEANYTVSGAQGLIAEGGSSRREAVAQLVESLGGKVEAFYFAFGGSDFILIADFPDSPSAIAASLTAGAAGGIGVKTTVLITAEEVDEAVRKRASYRAPGA